MRLEGKVAVIIGAGQQPGETIGNGRAVAIRFAQEGAKLLLVDNNEAWLAETVAQCQAASAETNGGDAMSARPPSNIEAFTADITDEQACAALAQRAHQRFGRIDILHNNVGRSQGDAPTPEMDGDVWDMLLTLNVKAMFMTAKHVLPVMRDQRAGVILNVSSTSSLCARQTVAYKTSKGAVNTLTHHLAMENAPFGIRANAILPGLMDTPMAIERRAQERGGDRTTVRAERDAQVPLNRAMGTAWDVAHAALFLASDEARYITGVLLPVDGGLSSRIG
ncbi:MAG: SDR family NAD(P)-dependent oxidoreductase [Pseudomonadota bacterium]